MTISPPRPGAAIGHRSTQRLPSAFRLRTEMSGISEAPGKVWFWELAAAVIDADRCVQCGACVAACPTDSIGIGTDDLPQLVKMCTGCSLCWDFCPRGGLRYEATWLKEHGEEPALLHESASALAGAASAASLASGSASSRAEAVIVPTAAPLPRRRAGSSVAVVAASGQAAEASSTDWRITGADPAPGLGLVINKVAARVRPGSTLSVVGAQDGGVSAILLSTLAAGDIDGAVVAREDPDHSWKGVPLLATTAASIRERGGSYYNQTMALASLDLAAAGLDADAKVAIVGTPCEIQGIRALQARQWRRGRSNVDAVVLSIALLCTKSFDYRKLMLQALRDDRGIDLAEVGKVDVIHGRLIVEDRVGANMVDEPIKDFHGAALMGCDECADFLGRAADISVGSVGSEAGYSSVLVRTEAGRRAFDLTAPELEISELSQPDALLRLDKLDKKIARTTLQRELDPDGPLFVDFAEHVTFYGGTDRAPVWK